MKPRLIKFTCPACNARLAVPAAMAGMEDNCPKCSERITAPALEPELAATVAPLSLEAAPEEPKPVTKAPRSTKPRESGTAPAERDVFRSTLFDEFLSTPASPPKEEVATPTLAASEVPSDAFPRAKQKPLKPEKPAPEPELLTPPLVPPVILPVPESTATITPVPRTLLEIISNAGPKPVAPPLITADEMPSSDPIEKSSPEKSVPEIDADDLIAEQSSPPTFSGIRHVLPSLGVGLIQVEDTPRQHRRHRRRRVFFNGILWFLLFDAVVCWLLRHRIADWWHERHTATVVQAVATPLKNEPAAVLPTTLPPAIPIEIPIPSVIKPEVKPEKIVPPLITSPSFPATAISVPAQIDLLPPSSASPSTDITIGSQIPNSLPSPPINQTITDPSLTGSDVRALIPSQPVEMPAPPAADNLIAKTEITPPPLPPPLPSSAAIPEVPEKTTVAETTPDGLLTEPGETTPSSSKIIEKGITKSSRPALEALKCFLAAPTWQYRLRWVQKPDIVKAAMEKHYRKYPDGPVDVTRIDFIERYPAKSGTPPYCMFEVSGGALKRKILVLVEEKNKSSQLVDWEAFVEFKDQLLWEFLNHPNSPSGKFRVMLQRKHYFDKDIPDIDHKEAFELSQPGADTTVNVFAVKGSSVAKLLSQKLAWGDGIAATIQLAWHNDGERGWVEVKAVPAFGWRG